MPVLSIIEHIACPCVDDLHEIWHTQSDITFEVNIQNYNNSLETYSNPNNCVPRSHIFQWSRPSWTRFSKLAIFVLKIHACTHTCGKMVKHMQVLSSSSSSSSAVLRWPASTNSDTWIMLMVPSYGASDTEETLWLNLSHSQVWHHRVR